jgi:hypothetical protein
VSQRKTLRGRFAESLIEDAFADEPKSKAGIITVDIASQLYATIGGIEARIGVSPASSIPSVRN